MEKSLQKKEKEPKYRRMTWTDRLVIEKLYNKKKRDSYRAIARELGFSHSSVYDEIQHGLYDHLDGATWLTVRKYSACIAQEHADWEATSKGTPIKLDNRHDYATHVAEQVQQGRSPDQITGTYVNRASGPCPLLPCTAT